jgi:hypothetical protein
MNLLSIYISVECCDVMFFGQVGTELPCAVQDVFMATITLVNSGQLPQFSTIALDFPVVSLRNWLFRSDLVSN